MPNQAIATPEIEVNWEYHLRQTEMLDILELPQDLEALYGGAKGGGKTVLGCRWMFDEAVKDIERFGLEPMDFPLALGFMGRKRSVDFTKTTLETWKREIPAAAYRINEQKHEIIIFDTVKYHYGGFDNRQVIEKFNSAEYCRAFIDQAEECTQDELAMLEGTFRLKINGMVPYYKILMSANPAQCWLKREFVKNPNREAENRYFVRALPSDNPYLPPSYIARLKKIYRHRPELLAAYLKGLWDGVEGADIIIRDGWVQASHNVTKYRPTNRKLVVADIARFGDDRTTLFYLEETEIEDSDIYGQRDTHYTSGRIAKMANDHKSEDGKPALIVVDGDGLGGPVADNLRAWGFEVREIHSAEREKSGVPDDYYNRRAQMWWEVGLMYANGEITNNWNDQACEELDTELTIPKYTFRDGKILVESKEEIKKPERYGKSPDLADTYVMGLWSLQFVTSEAERIKTRRRKQRRRAGAVSSMGI